jgi:chorismate mutase
MKTRGIRGAITVEKNEKSEILTATQELMEKIIKENELQEQEVAAILFTATGDLTAAYPAEAVRGMGWILTPLMCYQEMRVDGSLENCIRVVVLINTSLDQHQIKHIYLKGAKKLRPDLIEKI